MKEAALELRSNNNSNDELGIADTGVSVDGTWQKRGFTSPKKFEEERKRVNKVGCYR